jgi:hypothetical protein
MGESVERMRVMVSREAKSQKKKIERERERERERALLSVRTWIGFRFEGRNGYQSKGERVKCDGNKEMEQ